MWHQLMGKLRPLFLVGCALAMLAASGLATSTRAAESDAAPVFPYPIKKTVLDNGLTILTVPFDSPGTFSYYTIVRTGSRNEVEEGLSGFAHFFEHMMFRGTPTYSTEAYNEKLKEFGVDSNAFTTDDWTCYHLTASVAALPVVIELEADRFQNLSYDRAGFQKEARAVLGEYNKIASSPMLPLEEKLQDLAYDTHTYEHTTIGFLKDIVDMPNQYEYSLKFFKRWYRPDNCIVLVVGDVDHEGVVQLARRQYAGWKPGVAEIEIPQEPPQREERRAHLSWEGATLPYLYIGYHVPEFDPHSKDIAALDVLAEALFSPTSPLYRKLVLEQGKVEAIMAGATFRRDPTLFTILVRLRDAKDFDLIEREIYQTLEEASKQAIEASRLEDIKSHLRYSFAPDTTDEVARSLGTYLELTGDPQALNQMYATYARVTPEDVQRVSGKYFDKTNRSVVTLSSEEKTASSSLVPTHRVGTAPRTLRVPEPAVEVATADSATGQDAERPDVRSHAERGNEGVMRLAAFRRAAKDGKESSAPEVVHLPTNSTHVALRFTVRAGSQCDPPGKAGLAALTARLLSEGGTKELAYQELLLKLYPMAGSMDSRCDKELTLFAGKIHRDKLADFTKLFAATLLEPRFDKDDFERLRREQIIYLAASLRGNNDEELGKQTLQLMLYPPSHPYGHVEEGTISDLESITLDDVKQFYRTWYTPQNFKLGLAGDVSSEFLDKLAGRFGEKLPQGDATPPELPQPATIKGLEVKIVKKPNIATAISLGMPIDINRSDDDFYPLMVANSAFGEHRTFNGRLMRNMRGKRGLNYGDYSYIENFIQESDGSRFPVPNIPRRQQYFSIWIRPVPHDKGVFALREAVRELELLVRDGLSQEEFETTRKFLFNYSKLWVQDQSRRLGYQMDGQFYQRKSVVEELNRRLPTMTLKQVNAAIKKHLGYKNLAVAVVTQQAEAFRDKLLSGEPTPLVYDTEGTPAEVLAEDKIIQSYKLDVAADRLKIVPVEEMFE
jgi:zinc protease